MIIDPAPDPVRVPPPMPRSHAEIVEANADMIACLRRIANAHPTCGDSAISAFVNRVWAGHFRDIQRDARVTLKGLGYDL